MSLSSSIAVRCCGLVLFALFSYSTAYSQSPRSGQIRFGFASESIVPGRPVAIGGQYHTRISGEVHDPLMVTALAIECTDEQGVVDQVVWVSCDLVAIRRGTIERARELVAKVVPDLNVQKIIVSATHTHTAPALVDTAETNLHPYEFVRSWAYRIPDEDKNVMRPLEYMQLVERQLAQAIVRAWQSRQTGEFSFALSHVSIARNRRAVYFDGTTKMYGDTRDPNFSHTEGTSDDSLDCLFFWRGEQLAGLALTLYCPSQEVEGETRLSADFWYDVRTALRKKYGEDLFVLPLTGASGDQSPHIQVGKQAEQRMLDTDKRAYRVQIANRIVAAVDAVQPTAKQLKKASIKCGHQVEMVPLPVWRVPEERFAQAKADVDRDKEQQSSLSAPDYIRFRVQSTMIARHELQDREPNFACELHAVRLDDLALITNPFELYTDYSLRMKARSPAVQTSVVQLTSDCAAYLPTERAVAGGGYSARIDDGVIGPAGGRELVEQSVRLLKQLW